MNVRHPYASSSVLPSDISGHWKLGDPRITDTTSYHLRQNTS